MSHHYMEGTEGPKCAQEHYPTKEEIELFEAKSDWNNIRIHMKDGMIWCTYPKNHKYSHGYSTTGFKWDNTRNKENL